MRKCVALATALLFGGGGGCAPGGLDTSVQLGQAENTVGDRTEAQLIKCAQPLGTAAIVEEESQADQWGVRTATAHWTGMYQTLENVGLSNPAPLLRLMMSRSNCFQVVDRGKAGELMRQERELMKEGTLEEGSSPVSGQMVAADYLITPNVVFSDHNAGGSGAAATALSTLGGVFVPGAWQLGAVAGSIQTTDLEAQTVLYLTNVRTGLQESVAEGSARKRDVGFGFGGGGWFAGAAATAGAYANTDIGKIVSAAFLDAFNKLVQSVQG